MPARNSINRDWFLARVKINPDTGCWEWQLSREKPPILPYGRLFSGKRYRYAHRVAYETLVGPIPQGLLVLHHCDNPPCVNPEHLYAGTHADNSRDCHVRGRVATGDRSGPRKHPERMSHGDSHWTRQFPSKVLRGEASGRAKLTMELAQQIRSERGAGMTLKALATKYDVGISTIFRVVRGDIWV